MNNGHIWLGLLLYLGIIVVPATVSAVTHYILFGFIG